jgi:hypothetical protein
MTPSERHARLREIAERVVERVEREWPTDGADITEAEDLVERVGREMMRELTEELGGEEAQRRCGNRAACPECRQAALFRGYQSLTVVTLHGRVSVSRAAYYCRQCRAGFCPVDRRWRLGPANTTPAVQALVAALAAEVAYVQVPGLLARVGVPVYLGVTTVELLAQRLGAAIRAEPLVRDTPAERPLAVAVDGVMTPLRTGNKEARCAVIYEPAARNTPESPAGEADLRKEYVGTLGERDQLVQEACRRVELRRPTPQTKVAALGDGAPWIWAGYAAHLPQRVEILDLFHALQHVAVVAAARFKAEPAAARDWQEEQRRQLLSVGPQPLLDALRAWTPSTQSEAHIKRRELTFFRNNRHRMNYPRYLRDGWPIGSGAVEGACKHLIADRFRRTGMRWKRHTAEPLIHLRAALLTHPQLDLRAYVQ